MRKSLVTALFILAAVPAPSLGHAIHSSELQQMGLTREEAAAPARARSASTCYDFASAPAGEAGTIDTIIVNPAGTEQRNLVLAEASGLAAARAGGYIARASGQRKTFRFAYSCPGALDVKVLNLSLSASELQAMGDPQASWRISSEVAKAYGPQRNLQLIVVNGFMPYGIAGRAMIGPGRALVFNAEGTVDSSLDFTYTAVHELLHLMGAVNPRAPHGSPGLHCFEEADIMCYDDTTLPQPILQNCKTGHSPLPVLDCGGDDYFSPAPAAGSFLERNPQANTYNSPFLMSCSEDPGACTRGQRPVISDVKTSGVSAWGATASAWVDSLSGEPSRVWFVVRSTSRVWSTSATSASAMFEQSLPLKPGTAYSLSVTAENEFGKVESAPVEFRTPEQQLRISRVRASRGPKGKLSLAFAASSMGEVELRLGSTRRLKRVTRGSNRVSFPASAAKGGRLTISPASGYVLVGRSSFRVRSVR